MEGKFIVGQRVQAIDQLGKWSEARVISSALGTVGVTFCGWSSEFNEDLPIESVRFPVKPFDYAVGNIKCGKRKRGGTESSHLKKISVLEEGDTVLCRGEEMTVKIVDRFKRTITVIFGDQTEEVDVGEVDLIEEVPDQRKPKKLKRKRLTTKANKADTEASSDNLLDQTQPEGSTGSSLEKEAAPNVCKQDGYDYFSSQGVGGGLIQCGDTCELKSCQLDLAITSIKKEKGTPVASGWAIVNGKIMEDIRITAPVDQMANIKANLPRSSMQKLKSVKSACYKIFQKNLKLNHSMRKDYRKDQLKQLLKKEVQAALKSKCYKRSFNFGSFCHDTDEDILKLDPIVNQKLQRKIHDGSIAELDWLLGLGWDVREVEEGQNVFVTNLKLAVSSDCIVGSIKTAIFRGSLQGDYRRQLLQHVAST